MEETMAKKKYYAVKKGKTPGIYLTWEDCQNQINGFSGAVYKGFATIQEAGEFLEENGEAFSQNIEVSGTQAASVDRKTPAEEDSGAAPDTGMGEAVAYVDGSYNVKTGEYGCGVVFFCAGEQFEISRKGEEKELASMRNVAGEILGSELAMQEAVRRGVRKLTIFHDYQGIASWCLGEWKTNKEGTIAYKRYYDSLKGQIDISFRKVKGHSGDVWNDRADELARAACS